MQHRQVATVYKRQIVINIALLVGFVMGFSNEISALPLTIVSSPLSTSGPFIHNVFHTSINGGGAAPS